MFKDRSKLMSFGKSHSCFFGALPMSLSDIHSQPHGKNRDVDGHSENLAVVKLTEQLLFRRPVLRNRPTHPCNLHIMLQRNVFVGNIPPPITASHASSHWHTVSKGSGIGFRLRLTDHNTADGRHKRQTMNVVIVKRVYAAGMTFPADLIQFAYHVQSHFKLTVVLENRQHRAEFFTREQMFPADLILLDDKECLAIRKFETGKFRDL